MLNLTLALWPLFVAYFLRVDSTYTALELFFVFSCLVGLALALWLFRLDALFHNSSLERVHFDIQPSAKVIDTKDSTEYLPLEEID